MIDPSLAEYFHYYDTNSDIQSDEASIDDNQPLQESRNIIKESNQTNLDYTSHENSNVDKIPLELDTSLHLSPEELSQWINEHLNLLKIEDPADKSSELLGINNSNSDLRRATSLESESPYKRNSQNEITDNDLRDDFQRVYNSEFGHEHANKIYSGYNHYENEQRGKQNNLQYFSNSSDIDPDYQSNNDSFLENLGEEIQFQIYEQMQALKEQMNLLRDEGLEELEHNNSKSSYRNQSNLQLSSDPRDSRNVGNPNDYDSKSSRTNKIENKSHSTSIISKRDVIQSPSKQLYSPQSRNTLIEKREPQVVSDPSLNPNIPIVPLHKKVVDDLLARVKNSRFHRQFDESVSEKSLSNDEEILSLIRESNRLLAQEFASMAGRNINGSTIKEINTNSNYITNADNDMGQQQMNMYDNYSGRNSNHLHYGNEIQSKLDPYQRKQSLKHLTRFQTQGAEWDSQSSPQRYSSSPQRERSNSIPSNRTQPSSSDKIIYSYDYDYNSEELFDASSHSEDSLSTEGALVPYKPHSPSHSPIRIPNVSRLSPSNSQGNKLNQSRRGNSQDFVSHKKQSIRNYSSDQNEEQRSFSDIIEEMDRTTERIKSFSRSSSPNRFQGERKYGKISSPSSRSFTPTKSRSPSRLSLPLGNLEGLEYSRSLSPSARQSLLAQSQKKKLANTTTFLPYSEVRHLQDRSVLPTYNHSTIHWILDLCSHKKMRDPPKGVNVKSKKVTWVGLTSNGRTDKNLFAK